MGSKKRTLATGRKREAGRSSRVGRPGFTVACGGAALHEAPALPAECLRPGTAPKTPSHSEISVPERPAEWQAAFDAFGDAVCLLDLDRRIVRCNQAAAAFCGKSLSEMPGHCCCEVIHGRAQPVADCPVARMMHSRRRESMALTASGRSYQITVDPLIGASGELEGAVHIIRDITGRTQAEAALRESEERYRWLFDSNPDGVFVLDATGRFTVANPACETLSGYPVAELLAKTFMELCVPDRLAETIESFRCALGGRAEPFLETAFIRKDGRRVEVWVVGRPMVSGGRVVGLHCTAKDITARKQAEATLRQFNETLEQRVAERTQALHKSQTDLNHAQAVAHIGSWRSDLRSKQIE